MLGYHYADQIGHYTNDNHHVREHFQLEYKNDWQLRYMDFLENRSNQELMNRITNEMKQPVGEYCGGTAFPVFRCSSWFSVCFCDSSVSLLAKILLAY